MTTKKVFASAKQVIIGLQSSRMSEEEKTMWMAMLPYMSDQQLVKLANLLKSEADVYIDTYLEAMSA